MTDDQMMLIRHGSQSAAIRAMIDTLGLGRDDAEERAIEAYDQLLMMAPEEIRTSWPMVIAWSRMQMAYENALMVGDVPTQMKCAKEQAAMLKDLY